MADATPVHPLRQRMIEDMTLRGLTSVSQKTYVRAVRACCAHLRCRPDALTAEAARAFLLHLQVDADLPAPDTTPQVEADLRRLLLAMFELIGSAMKTREADNEQDSE